MEVTAKHRTKDTVFTDLFRIPRYQTELVNVLSPGINAKQEDIRLMTLKSVFFNQPYNDFGALVKDKLLFCIESQSTWSLNILFRLFIYAANTYQSYINDKNFGQVDLYSAKKQELPTLNCSVIYCGEERDLPDYISLNKDFWDGNSPLDLKVKVLNKAGKKDIVEEYVSFCHKFDEQVKIHGRTVNAVKELISVCLKENILRDYLEERKKEVQDIMFMLMDEEELQRRHWEYEKMEYAKELKKELTDEITEKVTNEVTEKVTNEITEKVTNKVKESGTITHLKNLMKNMNLSLEKAMDVLQIEDVDRKRYSLLLG
jgi:hypothetical protein